MTNLKMQVSYPKLWKYQKNRLTLPQINKTKEMDSRFTPRTPEEMLAAVRAFQERQRKWFEESDKRLEKRTVEHHLAV